MLRIGSTGLLGLVLTGFACSQSGPAVPRLTEDGKRELDYSYRAPEQVDDGWPVGELDQRSETGLNELMESILDQSLVGVESVLIARGGTLLVEEYFYGFDRNHPHQLRSVTKSVASLLIGIALEKGVLASVDTPIAELFPAQADKQEWSDLKRSMQLKHLLTMTSGLEGDDWKDDFALERAVQRSSDWVDHALTRPMVAVPGEHFAYSGGSLMILSGALHSVAGMSVQRFAARNLFEPLGINNVRWHTSPKGIPYFSAGLRITPRALAKIGQLCLDGGRWQDKQIVPAAWVAESTRGQLPVPGTGLDYGYLWWSTSVELSNSKSVATFMGLGIGGQHLFVVPERLLVVVITSGNYATKRSKVRLQGFEMIPRIVEFMN